MIGWKIANWERGRRDARAGHKAERGYTSKHHWDWYVKGWHHERRTMDRLGLLPQLALPLQDCVAPVAESPCSG